MRFRALSYAALLLAVPTTLAAQPAGKPRYGTWGVDLNDMDKSVRPGDDFFRYVEGQWLKTAQIKPDKSRAGYNYDLPDATEVEIRDLV
jgi:putative endopeptidase